MSKSQRTQEQYRKASKGQGTLSSFSFKAPSYPQRVMSKETVPKVVEPDLIAQPQPMDLPEVSAVVPQSQVAGPSRVRSASVLSVRQQTMMRVLQHSLRLPKIIHRSLSHWPAIIQCACRYHCILSPLLTSPSLRAV
jgi:hypothetical protein